jgi:hypothetical protein
MKTPRAAKTLGISYWNLHNMLRAGQVTRPQKDESGDYIWTPEDLERARQEITSRRRRKAVPSGS